MPIGLFPVEEFGDIFKDPTNDYVEASHDLACLRAVRHLLARSRLQPWLEVKWPGHREKIYTMLGTHAGGTDAARLRNRAATSRKKSRVFRLKSISSGIMKP